MPACLCGEVACNGRFDACQEEKEHEDRDRQRTRGTPRRRPPGRGGQAPGRGYGRRAGQRGDGGSGGPAPSDPRSDPRLLPLGAVPAGGGHPDREGRTRGAPVDLGGPGRPRRLVLRARRAARVRRCGPRRDRREGARRCGRERGCGPPDGRPRTDPFPVVLRRVRSGPLRVGRDRLRGHQGGRKHVPGRGDRPERPRPGAPGGGRPRGPRGGRSSSAIRSSPSPARTRASSSPNAGSPGSPTPSSASSGEGCSRPSIPSSGIGEGTERPRALPEDPAAAWRRPEARRLALPDPGGYAFANRNPKGS